MVQVWCDYLLELIIAVVLLATNKILCVCIFSKLKEAHIYRSTGFRGCRQLIEERAPSKVEHQQTGINANREAA